MKNLVDLLGRILIAFIFLFDALDSIWYFKETKLKMTEFSLVWRQDLLLSAAIFVLVVGGTLVLVGYRAKLGAVLLLLYWVPVTFIVHSFWNDPEELRRINSIHFMKNIAIIGGLLIIWANGSGKYSIRRLFATTKVPGV